MAIPKEKHSDGRAAVLPGSTSPSRRKLALFRLLVVVLALSPLILWETYLRATREPVDLWAETGRTTGPNPIRRWGLVDAFSAYRGRPGTYPHGKSINRHGFISTPDLAVAKPAGTLRIVFLGGSSTAGTGHMLADEETWPWKVANILRARLPGRNIEFINGAMDGYTSFESFGRLWSRIRFFSPDIVVLDHGWNEMYYFGDAARAASWRTLPDGSWSLDRAAQPLAVYDPLLIDHLIWPSQALSEIRLRVSHHLRGEVARARPLATHYDRRGLDIWRTHLQLFRETARIIGATLLVVKQPTLIVPDLPPAQRARCRYDYHGFDHDAHVDAYRKIYQVIDEEIPADRILDLTTLSGQPGLFYDHVHPTATGTSQIASGVAAGLLRFLRPAGGTAPRP
ncbi:MAG: SGNH/GDSL hydrolase family protein [Acidobacteriota bacterium]